MRRQHVWSLLSQVKTGFYLLLAASVLLFAGAIIVDVHSDDYRILNFMLLYQWLVQFSERPILYVWMFGLFAVLFALVINTGFCTWAYVKKITQSGITVKKIGIILFHVSFLLFLAGHLVYECTGTSETIILKKGAVSRLSGAPLYLEPVMLQRMHVDVDGEQIRMGTRTSLIIKDTAGVIVTIHPESMKPAFSRGYSFHIAMNERGLSSEQVRVIIRKSPGIYLFIVGAAGIVVALLLFMLGARARKRGGTSVGF